MSPSTHNARVLELELEAVRSLCYHINSPRSLSVWILIKYEEFDQLVSLSIKPEHYLDCHRFNDDYLVTSVLSKNPRLPTSFDRSAVAVDKFMEAERACAESNKRIVSFLEGREIPDLDVMNCLAKAQLHIKKILGPLTKRKLTFIEDHMRFGPGATTSLRGVVTQGTKYSHRVLDATPRALSYRTFSFPEGWRRNAIEISLRAWSNMRVVPKNAKTDRVICIEPDLNIFIQLGIGAGIREQLRIFGLDLTTQEWNRYLASIAHDFDLCTMDLTSASDTNPTEAVWLLLPFDWADLLYFARTDFVKINVGKHAGEIHELQKWSSMGNGYTFELETLIFYGVILGACEELQVSNALTSAYGDDLIFPNACRDLIQRTLSFLGFKVNVEKTFGKGIFHESCGTDWFLGSNVRPFFFRTTHHDFPTVCYITANAISSWASRNLCGVARDARCLPAWLRCYTACPAPSRHRIPSGYGDVGFVSSFEESTPRTSKRGSARSGFAGFRFSYRRIRPVERRLSEDGLLLANLNGSTTEWSLGKEALRGKTQTAITSNHGHVLHWPYTGPWV